MRIRVKKIEISLVVAMFVMLIVVFLSSGVLAGTSDHRAMSYSTLDSNPQYTKPGSLRGYSQQYASTYWPSINDADNCEAALDFVVYIRPETCTPKVVRSDLLEEQNVPVFCKVDLLKINPLIDVSQLKSVKFARSGSSPGIAGVSFHPNREAVYSKKGFIQDAFYDDVGYVVVLLRRIPAEKDMPDSIKVNLTAVLRYDVEDLFGFGDDTYYLSMDDDWNENTYQKNSFFRGKGYLKADYIENNKAKISVYLDKENKLTSFELKKGETSNAIYIPGFYCKAKVRFKLDNIKAKVKRVRLRIDDNYKWLVENEKFLDGKCRVLTISETEESDGRLRKEVKIDCKGVKSDILYYYPSESEEGSTTATNAKVSDEVKKEFEKARDYAYSMGSRFGGVVNVKDEVLAAKALYRLAILAEKLNLDAEAADAYYEIMREYPDTAYARRAEENLRDINELGEVNYESQEGIQIFLVDVDVPKVGDASADFVVYKKVDGEYKIINNGMSEIIDANTAKIIEKDKFVKDKEFSDGRFKLKELYPDKVVMIYYDDEGKGEKFTLSLKKPTETKGDYRITLSDIKVEKMVKVSLISDTPDQYSETDFDLEIKIEKRAIQLSPEKIKNKLAALNKSIEGWEDKVQKLGTVVKVMKGACLATSAVLRVKSLFNLGGGSAARQKVMPAFYSECRRQEGNEEQKFDECLTGFNTEIEAAVRLTSEQMKYLDEGGEVVGGILPYKIDEVIEGGEIKKDVPKTIEVSKTSDSQKKELTLYYNLYNSDVPAGVKKYYAEEIDKIRKSLDGKETIIGAGNFVEFYKPGRARIIPLNKMYGTKNKFYVSVPETSYTEQDDVQGIFWINSVGDDKRTSINMNQDVPPKVAGVTGEQKNKLVNNAITAIRHANTNEVENKRISILGVDRNVKIDDTFEGTRCTDFMSPNECKLLFNVCDPVVCPSSRCDLGGAYKVDNVIQSGIIGSIALCLPNYPEVYVPVCLTGIHAGLNAYVDILKLYRDCLQTQLDTGQVVGICDEMQSVMMCDFFYKNMGPYVDALALNVFSGGGLRGGGEYLGFENSWNNIQASNTFWDEYTAGSSEAFQTFNTGIIGGLSGGVCEMFVSQTSPNNGKLFDRLLEPDSPFQFHAWFSESPYSEATLPATSQYKVSYIISAGNDERVSYQIYLKNPAESVYVDVRDVVIVDTNVLPRGGRASEAVDLTAPAGYKELCVRINNQEKCGFGKVSSSFALNYISDEYYKEQTAKGDITKTSECISGSPSLYGVAQNPNIQAGVGQALNPELDKKGIIRICSTDNPGISEVNSRYQKVGYCDDEKVICWLDLQSVQNVIKNKNVEADVYAAIGANKEISGIIDKDGFLVQGRVDAAFIAARNLIEKIKEVGETREILRKVIESEDAGKPYLEKNINLYDVLNELTLVEDRGVGDQVQAEAVYHKYMIYEVITSLLSEVEKKVAGVGGGDDDGDGDEKEAIKGTVEFRGLDATEYKIKDDMVLVYTAKVDLLERDEEEIVKFAAERWIEETYSEPGAFLNPVNPVSIKNQKISIISDRYKDGNIYNYEIDDVTEGKQITISEQK